jgi:hypothetical protein
MEKLKNKTQELLVKNLLIKQEVKQHILQKINNLNKDQFIELINLLQKGEQITIKIFQKKSQTDPAFISKIKHIKTSIKMEEIKRVEEGANIEEEQEMEDLEKELLAL